jgi:hypothetical protein
LSDWIKLSFCATDRDDAESQTNACRYIGCIVVGLDFQLRHTLNSPQSRNKTRLIDSITTIAVKLVAALAADLGSPKDKSAARGTDTEWVGFNHGFAPDRAMLARCRQLVSCGGCLHAQFVRRTPKVAANGRGAIHARPSGQLRLSRGILHFI